MPARVQRAEAEQVFAEYMTSGEVARRLNLTPGSVSVMACEGRIPSILRGKNRWFHRDDVEHYAQHRRRKQETDDTPR